MRRSFDLRRVRPGDADAVWGLHVVALESIDEFDLFHGPHVADLRIVVAHYVDADGEFLVAVAAAGSDLAGIGDPNLVGCGGFEPWDDERALLKRMRVDPAAQGAGVGRAILSELESRARKRGYRTMVLETAWDFARARSFYEAAGYEELWREPFGFGQECYFRKRL